MTRWLGCVVFVVFGIVGGASAQGPPAPPLSMQEQLAVAQQRVLDLKDYRDWLEDQVALAKALLNETRQALTQKEAELAECRAPATPQR